VSVKKTAEKAESGQANEPILPRVGLSTWRMIAPFIPMCRESWRKLVVAGRAPQPIRLTSSCSMYRNEDVLAWLADPLGYRAAPVEQEAA
jgi:predicted DNA-binding transcriptional regulator AlpA